MWEIIWEYKDGRSETFLSEKMSQLQGDGIIEIATIEVPLVSTCSVNIHKMIEKEIKSPPPPPPPQEKIKSIHDKPEHKAGDRIL